MAIVVHSLSDVRLTADSPAANALDLLSGPMTLADRAALKSVVSAYEQAILAENAALKAGDAMVPDPHTVTNRQLRLWLHQAGYLAAVMTALESIPDESQRIAAQIEWDQASVFERSHSLVAMLGAAIGLATEEIDQAFIEAALL